MNDQLSGRNESAGETKQERRERRRAKEKTKMLQHGKSLVRIYKDAVLKRAKSSKVSRHSG